MDEWLGCILNGILLDTEVVYRRTTTMLSRKLLGCSCREEVERLSSEALASGNARGARRQGQPTVTLGFQARKSCLAARSILANLGWLLESQARIGVCTACALNFAPSLFWIPNKGVAYE